MPPHFFQEGLRVNAAGYIRVLETVVNSWIDQVAQGSPHVLQQDSTPAHKAGVTQELLAQNCHDHVTPNMWPPISSDVNPMDYYVWGVVEKEANKCLHNNKESLKAPIADVMGNMQEAPLICTCSRLRSRIEGVIETEGGLIE